MDVVVLDHGRRSIRGHIQLSVVSTWRSLTLNHEVIPDREHWRATTLSAKNERVGAIVTPVLFWIISPLVLLRTEIAPFPNDAPLLQSIPPKCGCAHQIMLFSIRACVGNEVAPP